MVVIRPCLIPIESLTTLATGARQFVVHDALEMTSCCDASYLSKFTPRTTVMSSPLAGAEMTTFLAPPAMCLAAFSRSVKKPVDSMTTSTPRSPHGNAAGSRSASTFSGLPSTSMASAPASTVPLYGPRSEAYLSSWASVLASVRALTATPSMSVCLAIAARKTLRPMRPKPLMPTRTGMFLQPRSRSQIKRRLTLSDAHHLDPQPVGVPEVARVRARAVLRARSGRPVVAAAVGQAGRVRGVDGAPPGGLQRDVPVARLRPAAALDDPE